MFLCTHMIVHLTYDHVGDEHQETNIPSTGVEFLLKEAFAPLIPFKVH